MKKNLNVLITGASRGIGNAIAKTISHRTGKMIVTSHYPETIAKGVEEIRKIYKGIILQYNIDQSKGEDSAIELSAWLSAQVDHLDALILCAGDYYEGKLTSISSNDFKDTMNTNFTFNFYVVRKLLPLLKRGKCPRIVIIGSTAAYSAYSVPSYGIAKFALRGFAVNLRQELMNENIGVTFVSPGPTLTDMWADVDVPPNRILEPSDIAKIVDNLFELSGQAVVEEVIVRPMLGEYDE